MGKTKRRGGQEEERDRERPEEGKQEIGMEKDCFHLDGEDMLPPFSLLLYNS